MGAPKGIDAGERSHKQLAVSPEKPLIHVIPTTQFTAARSAACAGRGGIPFDATRGVGERPTSGGEWYDGLDFADNRGLVLADRPQFLKNLASFWRQKRMTLRQRPKGSREEAETVSVEESAKIVSVEMT